jgi:hypothetical protein
LDFLLSSSVDVGIGNLAVMSPERPFSSTGTHCSRLTTIHREPGSDQSPQRQIRLQSTLGRQQCAPVRLNVRHGLMTANPRSRTLTNDEGEISSGDRWHANRAPAHANENLME